MQPLVLASKYEEVNRSYQPMEIHSPTSLHFNANSLEETQQLLRSKVKEINVMMGRDPDAYLNWTESYRKTGETQEKSAVDGFKSVKNSSSEPVLTYLRSIPKVNSTKKLHFPALPPIKRSQITSKSPTFHLSFRERASIQSEIESKSQLYREYLQTRVSKAMDRANKLHIFPKEINEIRAKSLIKLGEEEELAGKMRKLYRKKVEEIGRNRKEGGGVMITEMKAEQTLDLQGQKRVLLESKLVDKVAWAERKAWESAIQPIPLSTQEIDAKVKSLKSESSRHLPELRKVKNYPDAALV